MTRLRLDQAMVAKKIVKSRSQAESYIKLGKVTLDGKRITKPGHFVNLNQTIKLEAGDYYVNRAALKLAGTAENLGLDFRDKTVLDVGSSTGGFTEFALKHDAKKVIAVDVGTDQMHPDLRADPRIELNEKTDIRTLERLSASPDIVLIDVSFISLREILPQVAKLADKDTKIVAMVKPQFEAGLKDTNKGVIKNDALRRQILKDFEAWAKNMFTVAAKADSAVPGAKGNQERFYLLRKVDIN